jgi:glycosyltransferase involved in cell wall biosynthesis
MSRAVFAIGDVTDPRCWSGIPYYFWKAAAAAGFATGAAQLPLEGTRWPRRRWALRRLLTGHRPAGFQYSQAFLDRAEAMLPREQLAGEIISFQHHFPRARTVSAAGGSISYYLDAPFAALASGRGLDLKLPADVVAETLALDRENFNKANRIVTMAHWTAEVMKNECGVPAEKIFTILPGANLDLPDGWKPKMKTSQPGKDRPFVLGFVGADWQRKGLPLLLDVRDDLARRGWKAEVRAAGIAPPELARRDGMHFVGYLDKRDGTGRFVEFLADCDVGCLFSKREALGISTLEFLRVGVPVAGFAIEGPADTLPADAGFRFAITANTAEVADRFEGYLRNDAEREAFIAAAARHSIGVTWERSVREFQTLWATGRLESPFRLYSDTT